MFDEILFLYIELPDRKTNFFFFLSGYKKFPSFVRFAKEWGEAMFLFVFRTLQFSKETYIEII